MANSQKQVVFERLSSVAHAYRVKRLVNLTEPIAGEHFTKDEIDKFKFKHPSVKIIVEAGRTGE